MKQKMKASIALIMLLCIALTACQSQEERETKVETTMVRLYEVIPVPENVEAYGQYQYQYPVVRAGLQYGISMSTDDKASFLTAIDALQYRSGMDIEYVILGSWEELRQELQDARGDGVTKLVLFDNSYDQSLIKEAMTGGYVDFAPLMDEAGIYSSEEYQQAVLQAGQFGTQQLLVPILYNVAGITFGDKEYAAEPPTYDEFIDMIRSAADSRTDSQMSVVSKAMLDGVDPDLFWNAAGQPWFGYERQQEFFELLHKYVTNYDYEETMLKKTWSIYIEQLDVASQTKPRIGELSEDYLSQDELLSVGLDPDGMDSLWACLYGNASFYAECTGAESDPYHSILGTIDAIAPVYGGEAELIKVSENEYRTLAYHSYFAYLPIQMFDADGYAAQPFCYVAAMDDGDEEAAFKVIQEIMKQSFSLQFGFSVYEPAWRADLDNWSSVSNYNFERNSRYVYCRNEKWHEETGGPLFSGEAFGGDGERRLQVGEMLINQLDNIQYAQIADAEIMAIWQDTLAECATSGLSAEAGFELLCERMDEWEKELQ